MRFFVGFSVLSLVCIGLSLGFADGPGDNIPDKVRPIPPAGIRVPDQDREKLVAGLTSLGKLTAQVKAKLTSKPALLELLPDIEIYHKAVAYALQYSEFFSPNEIAQAHKLLAQGLKRATELGDGKPSWTIATGLVVRGYRSRIDGSVQPYGLVVPSTYSAVRPHRHRLDIWLHGRGEKLSEVNFILEHQRSPGQFVAADTFVLHPYGRYCNAFKFAGEIDVIEALEHAKKHYSIDENRLIMRGFSMGGAGCWQLAVHYPGMWAAAAPGAGFSETPDFLKVFQKETVAPPEWEKTLWRLHDCPGWAGNFVNLPLVAYSGEKDRQKQAADMMEPAIKAEGLEMVHIIGPGTEHSYHPAAKREIIRRIDQIAARGKDRVPQRVKLVTYTLRYNTSYWVRMDALQKHWDQAVIDASFTSNQKAIEVKATNVQAFTLSFGPGDCPLLFAAKPVVRIGTSALLGYPARSDRSWSTTFVLNNGKWHAVKALPGGLVKRHGLQGPIDDAFMDSFLMVRPTGQAMNEKVGGWARSELAHAIEQWRKQFRGDARLKEDTAVTEADIRDHNLVLWGDPSSNAVLKKIADKLPIRWTEKEIKVGSKTYSAIDHGVISIYPNPLNPKRYVVLNSGFTYREYDYLNNARQVPKLPDYAIIDLKTPPSSRYPGKVVTAGFYDEEWKLK